MVFRGFCDAEADWGRFACFTSGWFSGSLFVMIPLDCLRPTVLRAIMGLSLFAAAGTAFGQADYKRFYDEDNLPRVRQIFQQGGYEFVIQICDYSLSRGQPS